MRSHVKRVYIRTKDQVFFLSDIVHSLLCVQCFFKSQIKFSWLVFNFYLRNLFINHDSSFFFRLSRSRRQGRFLTSLTYLVLWLFSQFFDFISCYWNMSRLFSWWAPDFKRSWLPLLRAFYATLVGAWDVVLCRWLILTIWAASHAIAIVTFWFVLVFLKTLIAL